MTLAQFLWEGAASNETAGLAFSPFLWKGCFLENGKRKEGEREEGRKEGGREGREGGRAFVLASQGPSCLLKTVWDELASCLN